MELAELPVLLVGFFLGNDLCDLCSGFAAQHSTPGQCSQQGAMSSVSGRDDGKRSFRPAKKGKGEGRRKGGLPWRRHSSRKNDLFLSLSRSKQLKQTNAARFQLCAAIGSVQG